MLTAAKVHNRADGLAYYCRTCLHQACKKKCERNGTVQINNFYTNGKGIGTVSHMPEGLQIPEIVYAKKTLGRYLEEESRGCRCMSTEGA